MKQLTDKQKKGLDVLAGKMNGKLRTHLNSCVHCGLCGESCHYYLTFNDPKYMPGNKVDMIMRVYKRYFTLAGRTLPAWVGAKDLDDTTIDEMVDVIFGGCSMCGRCAKHCSVGVDIPFLVRTARSMLTAMELTPTGLQSTVDTAMETGNNMGIPTDDLIDTLEWLEEDLAMESGFEDAKIPLNAVGQNVVYTLNPREPKFFPMSISAMAMIFYAAEESWTISTKCYDVTNYPYYSGDDKLAGELVQRLYDEVINLEGKKLVLAECGHGPRAIRWEGPGWIQKKYPFKIQTVVELIYDYIKQGRIKLDPAKNQEPVTLHDPCNLARSGGVIEEPRFILKHAVANFIEMTPKGSDNYCCGGGGGQLSMGKYADRRMKVAEIKAEQIRNTGAKIVVTPCHNCVDQLMEVNKEYKLDVKIKTMSEIVADALVL